MKAIITACALALTFSTSVFAQYIGMENDGYPRPGQVSTRPVPPVVTPAPDVKPVPLPFPNVGPAPMPAPAYRTYGAIAFNQYTGRYGHSAGLQYEQHAVQAALNYCGYGCQLVAVASGAYIALAVGRGGGFGYAITPVSLEAAKSAALANCREHTRRCKIRSYVFSP